VSQKQQGAHFQWKEEACYHYFAEERSQGQIDINDKLKIDKAKRRQSPIPLASSQAYTHHHIHKN
jgi:hypothetical protein